jgi:hypothetical protein
MSMNDIEKNILLDNNYDINEMLEYPLKHFKRKMIYIVISDLDGANSINDKVLRKVTASHDLLFINISDASMYGDSLHDIDSNSNVPFYISRNKKLKEVEENIKKQVYNSCVRKFKKYRISTVTISSKSEIVNCLIDLLERHNHAVRH